jgi:hypothetical protein
LRFLSGKWGKTRDPGKNSGARYEKRSAKSRIDTNVVKQEVQSVTKSGSAWRALHYGFKRSVGARGQRDRQADFIQPRHINDARLRQLRTSDEDITKDAYLLHGHFSDRGLPKSAGKLQLTSLRDRLESSDELPAKNAPQYGDGKEEAWVRSNPAALAFCHRAT